MENYAELKPCPFCGGKAISIPKPRGWTVECERRFTLDDLCSVNLRTRYADTQAESVKIWNTRPPESALRTRLEKAEAANKVMREALEWIPVEEGLPLRSGIYYVTFHDGRVGTSAFYVGAFDRAVIAWMPRPEPYIADTALKAAGEGD